MRPRALASTAYPSLAERLEDIDWALRETEIRYRDLLDNQEDVILRCDSSGRVTFVNTSVCTTFAVTPAVILGTQFLPRVVSGHRPPALTPDTRLRRQRFSLELETAAGPRWFDFEEHVATAGSLDFETQLVGRDITEQHRQELELAEARDQAEAANRAKSRFLAAMSHEIRTPMNGILGMGTLLKDTEMSADQRTFVQAIDRSARTLLALIDEILDFSKIEAGKLDLEARTFNIEDCVQSVVELLAPKANEKGIELAWAIDPALPEMVLGDEMRVRQIVTNLVGNAVKFTETGGVLVTVGLKSHAGHHSPIADPVPNKSYDLRLAVSVADSGIGIKPEAIEMLFSEFEQGDPAVHRQHGGTGLGLAISRRLARAMDGDILVSSDAGHGSRFTATMTLQRVNHARPLRSPGADNDATHVLLAGLMPVAEAALRLTFDGAHVPVEAVAFEMADAALAAAAREGVPFTVVIMDGSVATAEAGHLLAAAKTLNPNVDVRGIVSFDAKRHQVYDRFKLAGFNGYLLRPVRPSSLLVQTLGGHFGRRVHRPAIDLKKLRSFGAHADERRRLRVLLAEDNEINALVARRMLEHSDCDVTHVGDGNQAVRLLTEPQAAAGVFDLVLMDMHMPVMDGLDATRCIRRHFSEHATVVGTRRAPYIVALTANAFAEDRQRCLDAGMDDYLAKPFERAEFDALIERLRRPD